MIEHDYVMTNDERSFETQVQHLDDGKTRTRRRYRRGLATDEYGEPIFGEWSMWRYTHDLVKRYEVVKD